MRIRVKMLIVMALAVLLCGGVTFSAQASLVDNGGGLIYDTDLNITWYDNPNYATHVYGDYVTWAADLTVGGGTDWRLPRTPGTATGYTNQGEMGHLFYTELGNPPGSFPNKGPFTNLTATYLGFYAETSPNGNYYFDFNNGEQQPVNIGYWYFWIHGLAVHDGNIGGSQIPLPPTVLLLGSGFLGLAGWRKFRKG